VLPEMIRSYDSLLYLCHMLRLKMLKMDGCGLCLL
jgi:hypothetical protein